MRRFLSLTILLAFIGALGAGSTPLYADGPTGTEANSPTVSDSNHTHQGQTWTGNNNPLTLNGSFSGSPLSLSNLDGRGLIIGPVGRAALRILNATDDGIFVFDSADDGVHVRRVGPTNANGLVDLADLNGFEAISVRQRALYVGYAHDDGIQVASAGINGVTVVDADGYGTLVRQAGFPTTTNTDFWDGRTGLSVFGASGFGLFVGHANLNGVTVRSARSNGVVLAHSQNTGLQVQSSGDEGLYISEINGSSSYSAIFYGSIHAGNGCSGCLVVNFGRNVGSAGLEAGDLVALSGDTQVESATGTPVLSVQRADGTTPVVGVVLGRADEHGLADPTIQGNAELQAQPSELVAIAVHGLAQVKASDAATMQPGTRLAAGSAGIARALATTTVNGMMVAEEAHQLGIVASAAGAAEGRVWVLINPQ